MMQTVLAAIIAITTVAALVAMSLWAHRRFATAPRLPMQWGLDGAVTWMAPRKAALAFTPVVAGLCLGLIVVLAAFGRVRPGQEALVAPINLLMAVLFLGLHALHLWLMQRTLRRQG